MTGGYIWLLAVLAVGVLYVIVPTRFNMWISYYPEYIWLGVMAAGFLFLVFGALVDADIIHSTEWQQRKLAECIASSTPEEAQLCYPRVQR